MSSLLSYSENIIFKKINTREIASWVIYICDNMAGKNPWQYAIVKVKNYIEGNNSGFTMDEIKDRFCGKNKHHPSTIERCVNALVDIEFLEKTSDKPPKYRRRDHVPILTERDFEMRLNHSRLLFEEIEKELPMNKEALDSYTPLTPIDEHAKLTREYFKNLKKIFNHLYGVDLTFFAHFLTPYNCLFTDASSYNKIQGNPPSFVTSEITRTIFTYGKTYALLHGNEFGKCLLQHLKMKQKRSNKILEKYFQDLLVEAVDNILKPNLLDSKGTPENSTKRREMKNQITQLAGVLFQGMISLSKKTEKGVEFYKENIIPFREQNFEVTSLDKSPSQRDFAFFPIVAFSFEKMSLLKKEEKNLVTTFDTTVSQIYQIIYQTLEKYGDGLRDVWRETNNFMHELEKIQKEYKKHRHLVLNERRPLLGICDLCKDTPRIIGNEEKVKTENP